MTVAGNLSPVDLLHLRGHFGIPDFDGDGIRRIRRKIADALHAGLRCHSQFADVSLSLKLYRVKGHPKSMQNTYNGLELPEDGKPIEYSNGQYQVPDNPIIPFIEGDGTGRDIWKASQRVFDAAVEKAYGGKRASSGLRSSPAKRHSASSAPGCPTTPSPRRATCASPSRDR